MCLLTEASAQDIGGEALSYAEVKAIASGNPAVLTLAEADADLQRLAILRKNHADEQFLARRNLRELPQTIARLSDRLSKLTADLATAEAHADDLMTIGNRRCSREDAAGILGGAHHRSARSARNDRSRPNHHAHGRKGRRPHVHSPLPEPQLRPR